MKESNLKNTPFDPPIRIGHTGRVRIILPVLGEVLEPEAEKYQDDEINRLIYGQTETDEHHVLKIAIHYDDVEIYAQMEMQGLCDNMTKIYLKSGGSVDCMLDFDIFDDIMNQIDERMSKRK